MNPWPAPYTQILSQHFDKVKATGKARPRADRTTGRPIDPRVIVIHTTEGHERTGSARNTAAWFRNPLALVSAHFAVDAAEIVQCVETQNVAWHASKANYFSIGVELCATAKQTAAQWLDEYSVAELKRAAQLIADLTLTYNIDVRKLTDEELRANYNDVHVSGICGHNDVSRVFGGTHYDPGPSFPWLDFMLAIQGYRELLILDGRGTVE